MDGTTLGIIVGLFGIVIPIIVSLIIYYRQKNKKEIAYSVLSLPLLNIREEIKDKVKILFKERPARDTHLVVLKVWNSGNVPILPTEFVDPITFNFGDNIEVLDVSVLEAKPEVIKNKIKFELSSNKLILKPILLNKDYSITIKLLIDRFDNKVNAEAMIAGIAHLQRMSSGDPTRIERQSQIIKILMGIIALFLSITQLAATIAIFNSYIYDSPYYKFISFIFYTFPLFTSMLIIYYVLFSYVEFRNKKREQQRYAKLLS